MSLLAAAARRQARVVHPSLHATRAINTEATPANIEAKKEPSDIAAPLPTRDVMVADAVSGAPSTCYVSTRIA